MVCEGVDEGGEGVCVCVLCVRVWECEDDGGTRIVFKRGQAATEVGSATPSRAHKNGD